MTYTVLNPYADSAVVAAQAALTSSQTTYASSATQANRFALDAAQAAFTAALITAQNTIATNTADALSTAGQAIATAAATTVAAVADYNAIRTAAANLLPNHPRIVSAPWPLDELHLQADWLTGLAAWYSPSTAVPAGLTKIRFVTSPRSAAVTGFTVPPRAAEANAGETWSVPAAEAAIWVASGAATAI